jgi:hypothetical protein
MATANPIFTLISSEDLEGTKVFGATGEEIGKVGHLMIDKVSGKVRYAMLSFGGFLGLGRSHYPLPWNALKYDADKEGYVAPVTEQQLREAPEFSGDEWMNREWETRWHQHFQAKPYWEEGAKGESQIKP